MGSLSIWHWLIVLIIVVVIFGTKRLRSMGGDLGAAMRDFKKGLNGDEANAQLKADPPASSTDKVAAETRREPAE